MFKYIQIRSHVHDTLTIDEERMARTMHGYLQAQMYECSLTSTPDPLVFRDDLVFFLLLLFSFLCLDFLPLLPLCLLLRFRSPPLSESRSFDGDSLATWLTATSSSSFRFCTATSHHITAGQSHRYMCVTCCGMTPLNALCASWSFD